jgi:7-carboxy-7-deazaguanine synthase
VITGGEPLMHDLTVLTTALKQAGFRTHLETSGTHPVTGTWDHICFSPKKFKAPVPGIYQAAHELKVIVFNKHDLKWAQEHEARVPRSCKLFLQPEWDKRDQVMSLIVEFVKEHPQWQVSLQTHKYLDIP